MIESVFVAACTCTRGEKSAEVQGRPGQGRRLAGHVDVKCCCGLSPRTFGSGQAVKQKESGAFASVVSQGNDKCCSGQVSCTLKVSAAAGAGG